MPRFKETTFYTRSTASAQLSIRNGNIRGMQLTLIMIAPFFRFAEWSATAEATIAELERTRASLKIEDLMNISTPGGQPDDSHCLVGRNSFRRLPIRFGGVFKKQTDFPFFAGTCLRL
jgi:hypothetical protein